MVFLTFKLLMVIAGVGAILFTSPAKKEQHARDIETASVDASADTSLNSPIPSAITFPSSIDDLFDERT